MARPIRVLVLLAVALLVQRASAQESSDPAAQRGQFHVTFTEPNPQSSIEAQTRRYRIKSDPQQRYELANESFEAYVPEDFDPAKPYGLLVWINSGKGGAPSKGWPPILTKNHLIWIGANGSGNDRGIGVRVGLALDAAYNFCKRYNIDESRIYAVGPSGGGKVASLLGINYPETFTGAIPIVGIAYYRPIPVAGRANSVWEPIFPRPAAATYDLARQQGRFVLITGTNDMNRDSIKDTYSQGFVSDGFKHVEYVEVPGMGHAIPEAEVIEAAIASLDAPLSALAKEQFARAQLLEKNGKFADALKLYTIAANHAEEPVLSKAKASVAALQQKSALSVPPPTTKPAVVSDTTEKPATKAEADEADAQKLLTLADAYERNHLSAQAKQRLEKIVKDYPTTKAAAKAKATLERMRESNP